MNDPKMLKIALVAVIVASATFIGYSWYHQQQLQRKVEDFTFEVSKAETEQQAAVAINNFIQNNQPSIAGQSANAGFFHWLKRAFGGGGGGNEGSFNSGYHQRTNCASWEKVNGQCFGVEKNEE